MQVTRVSGTVREAVVAFVSECCRGPRLFVTPSILFCMHITVYVE